MFNSTILDNKLTIASYKLPYAHSVAINFLVKVGSRYENLQENGISHFLEHMAFKGTKKHSAKQIAEMFDNIGGSFNAYTSLEFTVYHAKTLREDYKVGLEIIIDILQNSIFDPEEIKKELEVIRQEINATQDNPDDLAQEIFHKTAFGKDNSFARSILGSYDNISKFTQQNFIDYIKKHYNASNMIISVAGNIEHEDLVNFIQESSKFTTNEKNAEFSPSLYHGGIDSVYKELEQSTIMLGFESFSSIERKYSYRAKMLSILFGGGISSRLFQNIREKLGLCYSVYSFNSAYNDSGLFSIYAACAHDKMQLLIESIGKEVNSLLTNIHSDELNKTKAQIIANIKMSQESVSYISSSLAYNLAIHGKNYDYNYILDNYIIPVTTSDLIETAKQIFSKNLTCAFVGDKDVRLNYDEISNTFKI